MTAKRISRTSSQMREDIDKIQAKGYNKENYHIIIGIGKSTFNLDGFIKNFDLDFHSGEISYSLTEDINEAFVFTQKVTSLLYHYFSKILESSDKHNYHYPVS